MNGGELRGMNHGEHGGNPGHHGGDPKGPHPFDAWYDKRNYQLAQREPGLKEHMREAWNASIDHSAFTIVMVAVQEIKKAKKPGALGTGPE